MMAFLTSILASAAAISIIASMTPSRYEREGGQVDYPLTSIPDVGIDLPPISVPFRARFPAATELYMK